MPYREKSMLPRILLGILGLLVIAVVILFFVYQHSLKPVDATDTTDVVVVIEDGSGAKGAAGALKDADVIRSEFFFLLRARLDGKYNNLRAGTYTLKKSMSTDDILVVLTKQEIVSETTSFTIPEGYNITQIKNRLVEAGLVTEEEFLNEVANGVFDYKFMEGLPAGPERLEGFLYPDTYEVYVDAGAHAIIDKMLARFDELFKPEYYTRAQEVGLTVFEAVNMASIIERESVVPEERPVMARVFYNRLNIDMPLQSCATIQYILGEPKEFLSVADTQIESPYNTYLHLGMPPGPICNPRIESIEAALYPAKNDYIFFVLSEKLDGSHNFSDNEDQFAIDSEKYADAVGLYE
ncbi:MAG: endolytic transglycosylase MltG [Clostridiales Family XIII bacterium]|jgi:UPF0755 protein|nr:endolytic transglycosylase MltG [Clostridiales Family XIII bacterium]